MSISDLRRRANDNPGLTAALLGSFVLFMFLVLLWQLFGRPRTPPSLPPTQVWFYDLTTGKLFTAGCDLVAPIEAPSGGQVQGMPAGVRAQVFSCGDCADESQRFVAYLEMFGPQTKQELEASLAQPGVDPDAGMLLTEATTGDRYVRDLESEAWVPSVSDAGRVLTQKALARCPDGVQAKPCWP